MKTHFNRKGFTLVEVLVAATIIGFMGLSMSNTILDTFFLQKQVNTVEAALIIEDNLKKTLNDTVAWTNTYNATENANLFCLRTPQEFRNCQNQAGSFALYNSSGNIVINPANQGYDTSARVCNNPGTGNCIFGLELNWNAVCPTAGACSDPMNRFVVQLNYLGPKDKSVGLSTNKHRFSFLQATEKASLKGTCESVGGTFDTTTQQCVMGGLAGNCPPNFVVVQVTASMNKVCRPVFVGSCPVGQYMTGINSNGNPVCATVQMCTAGSPDVAANNTTGSNPDGTPFYPPGLNPGTGQPNYPPGSVYNPYYGGGGDSYGGGDGDGGGGDCGDGDGGGGDCG